MANQEHLDKLKEGVGAWNQWRNEHQDIQPDLSDATLSRATLSGANLSGAYLINANLSDANLSGATLSGANLSHANLRDANLNGAHLSFAYLSDATLSGANLSYADLNGAYLRDATLSGAYLNGAHLSDADLRGAHLIDATVTYTTFGNVDLSATKGLETIKHDGPSTIGIDTIYRSHGNIPEVFLRKAGVPEPFITNMRALVASMSPLDFYSCFISYSSKNQPLAERLYADLQSKGVRCWFAPEDMKIGDKIRPRIDESIRLYDKLLLVLSEDSVASQWVEHEVETAMGKELEGKPNVLFPIRLDQAIMDSKTGWASHVRLTRHIGDFTRWKNHDEYQKAFERLLRDLKQASS
jgi:TIR domain/Pentapeptide repeats (8 copies)